MGVTSGAGTDYPSGAPEFGLRLLIVYFNLSPPYVVTLGILIIG